MLFISFFYFIGIEILVKKMPSNSLFNWISKYRHSIFRISRELKMESENDSLDYKQDIEKMLQRTKRMIFIQMTLQMMI